MARLVPIDASDATTHLGALEGWLDPMDPYFSIIDEIVASRELHRPRIEGLLAESWWDQGR